jgi:hypothetical protein
MLSCGNSAANSDKGLSSGEVTDARDYFSEVVWEPGYHWLQSNARLLRGALRRGVSVERVQDLELLGNVALLRVPEPLPLLRRLRDLVVPRQRRVR